MRHEVFAVSLVALVACGDNERTTPLAWSVGVRVFDGPSLGIAATRPGDARLEAIEDRRRLVLPTYDGSGQVVHPDVLLERDRFVMAMTPYPYSNDDFENPSVIVGTDGVAWQDIGENPLAEAPPYDHNDDPDLRVDPRTGEYELLYLETLRPERQTMVSLRSRDLVTWARRDALVYDYAQGATRFMVSPAAIDRDGVTHVFYVETIAGKLEELTSADGVTWDADAATPVALDAGAIQPWHVDVFPSDAGYVMLVSGFEIDFGRQNLYLATSPDLVAWTLAPEPLLAFDDPSLDVYSLYRSTGVAVGNRLVVWYSMKFHD